MNSFGNSARLWFAALLGLVLASCASNVPEAIRNAPPENPSLEAVRANIAQFTGQRVRWGGEIVKVENQASDTLIEIIARRLGGDGRPESDGDSQGRFIARFQGFVDPDVYKVGRLLTVVGIVDGTIERNIGKYAYRFPVVRAENSFLWQPYPYYYNYPYYYDPFWYDPWYPYFYPYPYPYPYYGGPYFPY